MIYVAVLVVALCLDVGNWVAWFAYEKGFAAPTIAGAVFMVALGATLLGVLRRLETRG